jgi:hypothetical protein
VQHSNPKCSTTQRLAAGWLIVVFGFAGFHAQDGTERVTLASGHVARIKWGESCPPKPIKVWLERAKGGS